MDYPIGSFEENLAVLAITRKNHAQFMTTLLIVNAIIHVGNCIQAALSGGSASDKGAENLQKMVDALKSLLIPSVSADAESKEQRLMKILQEETAKGPLTVRPMAERKDARGRVRRSRRP